MRIYRMTATFGKLEGDTLELKPGLNVIQAPNEWGKSTWCAFLMAMLYGLDTRAKSTKTALADKERYAPWSGSPMGGRMDLRWQGRDITIERSTKGRIPLGVFRAYETESGIPIPELTAANCGQVLLGVEQSVFRRSGFIRLNDLPVTADEDLRRRLNALVTTGDESGDGDRLEQDLRELRNRCRYHRTGLIPQAEEQRDSLESKLRELEDLQSHCRSLKQRLGEVKGWLRLLENHKAALAYAAAEADADRVAQARDAHLRAISQLEAWEKTAANLPAREEAEKKLRELTRFREEWNAAHMEASLLPDSPQEPELPHPFEGLSLDRAEEMLGEDLRRYELLTKTKPYLVFGLMALAFLALGAVAAVTWEVLPGAICGALGLGFWIPCGVIRKKWKKEAAALAEKYGTKDADLWTERLAQYRSDRKVYALALVEHQKLRCDLDARLDALEKQRQSLCGLQSPEEVGQIWQRILDQWEQILNGRREVRRWEQHLQALTAMAKTAAPPEMADDLTYPEGETLRLIAEAQQEQQRLQNRLGQYQGRMEALGEESRMRKELGRLQIRLEKLENTYDALTLALETLQEAKLELQRRFAPRITRRAKELLSAMTGGRYDRLHLGEDFSLRAGAEGESVEQNVLWRSDGTVDQLYLALRLAVAEELIPQAPLVLDDALVRFDDARLNGALRVLKEQAQTKQILLFTCQSRETAAMQ